MLGFMRETTRRIIAAGRRRKLMLNGRHCLMDRTGPYRRLLAEQLREYEHAERRKIYRDG
jgi:hypothetical protein